MASGLLAYASNVVVPSTGVMVCGKSPIVVYRWWYVDFLGFGFSIVPRIVKCTGIWVAGLWHVGRLNARSAFQLARVLSV